MARGRQLERESARTPREEALLARERRVARTARLQAITAALSRAVTPDDVARTLVERALDAIGAHEGGVWLVDPGGRTASILHQTGLEPAMRERFGHLPLDAAEPAPVAVCVASCEPLFAESRREAEARWPMLWRGRAGEAAPAEYAFACLPLEAEGRCIGAASFILRERRRFDEDDRVFLIVLARQAAQALLRARLFESERTARAQAEAAERRAAFLAQASALLASSLEWEATVASVARLAVPGIADWCAVELSDALAKGTGPVVVAHVDPAKVALARALRERYPPDPDAPTGVPAVMRTGRPEMYPSIADELLVGIARDEEHLRVLREVGMTSAMCVPLWARGRALGAVTLVAAESGRHYGPADLAMAEELGRLVGVAFDNARLYADAQRAIRAREEVLAVVSHDLKNPLEAVMLSAALLLRTGESPRVQRYAETVQRSAARMDRLIRELLDLSSIDAGRFRVEPRPERLHDVIEEALAVLSPLANEKDVILRAEPPERDEEVPLDRERILQVLSNVVGNAVQFSGRGGTVTVRSAVLADRARVEVADDGPGIAEEDLPHVFDRFWKSHSRRGTGLGLAIARGIVEAHGGELSVESRVGEGSKFVFTLPR
jgi:signal transduction histidine kinase